MLRKNVASQVLTFNLVNATTGAALTGATVTTKVTLDGTQSASAGALTELGTGQYKYVPTQAETNGASVGCSFTATNAVPVNLHCFTIGQDPALTTFDTNPIKWNGTAVSAPATAGIPEVNVKNINNVSAAAVTTVKAVQGLAVDGVITTLTNLPAITANWLTAAGTAADFGAEVAAAVWGDTVAGDFTVAASVGKSVMNGVALGTGLTVAAVSGAVGSVTGAVGSVTGSVGSVAAGGIAAASFAAGAIDATAIAANAIGASELAADAVAEIAAGVWGDTVAGDFTVAASVGKSVMNGVALGTGLTVAAVSGAVGSVTGAVGSVTGAVGSIAAAGIIAGAHAAAELNAIADAILDRNMATGTDNGTDSTVVRTVRQSLRRNRNKEAIAAGTLTVYKEDDTTASFTAAVTTAAGNPVSVVDPT